MYSLLKNIQILVSLLREHGVSHVVISPGGCNLPIVRSIEADSYFTCYSVVDERSAAFFAMGVAQSLKCPVAVLCTSGTAVCNYLSGVTEAFYQGVPVVVITADRHPYLYQQMETQKINQIGIFDDVCKKSVTLPVVHDDNDFWYCQRLVNEALLELNHHGSGPVHINIPTGVLGIPADCTVQELPEVEAIRRVLSTDSKELWRQKAEELSSYKRILVVFGQNRPYSDEDVRNIEQFGKKYNCVLSVEHLSNLKCDGSLITYPVTEMISNRAFKKLLPDLVISLGYNISGVNIKTYLRSNRGHFKHWLIEETGNVKDVFKGLSVIFECTPSDFFKIFDEYAPASANNDRIYYNQWRNALDEIKMPEFPFSNMYVAQKLSGWVPENSILHLGILNSTRQMQFFSLRKNIEVFSNVGALGIDGSMSTFIGQAAVVDKLCFLLIGDLSFFYDMNSIWLRHVGRNVRIVMVNNGGGGEFHYSPGIHKFPRINEHIGAKHSASAKGWVESLGFRYYSASTEDELDDALSALISESDCPVFLEAFTDMELDGEITRQFYSENDFEDAAGKSRILVRNVAKSMLGDKAADKAIKFLKTIVDK